MEMMTSSLTIEKLVKIFYFLPRIQKDFQLILMVPLRCMSIVQPIRHLDLLLSKNEANFIMRVDNSNDDIILNTGGSTYFNNDHNFGLGMSNPSAKLHIQKNNGDTDFTNETTPSSTSGVQIANLATGAGTFTALTLSVSSGSATQNASVIAKATSSGTAPEMHFTREVAIIRYLVL